MRSCCLVVLWCTRGGDVGCGICAGRFRGCPVPMCIYFNLLTPCATNHCNQPCVHAGRRAHMGSTPSHANKGDQSPCTHNFCHHHVTWHVLHRCISWVTWANLIWSVYWFLTGGPSGSSSACTAHSSCKPRTVALGVQHNGHGVHPHTFRVAGRVPRVCEEVVLKNTGGGKRGRRGWPMRASRGRRRSHQRPARGA